MRCVQIDASGNVVDVVPQPADASSCTLVLAEPSEVASVFPVLTTTDALAIAVAAGSFIALAGVLRQFARM